MEEINKFLTLMSDDLDDESKEEIYEILLRLQAKDLPRKYLRKVLELSLIVLTKKREQILTLQNQLESKSYGDEAIEESANEKIVEENESLKRQITKLESEKSSLKTKLKEMSEEIIILQKRLHEIAATESDKDSTDPLSELDRQEELLKNISTKNKHIKRLIRDIEALQLQNIEQSKKILDMDRKSEIMKSEILEFQSQLADCKTEKKQLKDHIDELTAEISRLESNITYLEDEREKADIELKDFIEKLEERAKVWRNIIDEKESQLESFRKKYELLNNENPKRVVDTEEESQVDKLVEAVQERDCIIEELETKLKTMAEEMMSSTKLMNRISAEREAEKLSELKKNRSCCKTVQDSLNVLQNRYRELSEILEKVEDDNLVKSKQAAEAIKTLDAYQKGEDGLANSLRKVAKLEQKLNSRDKQIKALVMEVNSLHEIAQENTILRKRLNIPEDAIISTHNLVAKQRNKDKMLERVTLKLRASEENRLQLKLGMMDLKKETIELRKKLNNFETENEQTQRGSFPTQEENYLETKQEIYCDNCLKNIQVLPNQNTIIQDVVKEWEVKYSSVIEENENLRIGMHEILEKIRDYDASSDHIIIDCSILERVLHALDARSISGWYHPAMRMQNELIAVKEREQALKEKITLVEKTKAVSIDNSKKLLTNIQSSSSSSLNGNRSQSEDKQMHSYEVVESQELTSEIEHELPSSTKVSKEGSNEIFPMIVEKSFEHEAYRSEIMKLTEKNRELQIENETMKTYKLQFQELVEQMKSTENQITNYCSTLVERLSEYEIKSRTENKKYEFIKEDFDRVLNDYKESESKNIIINADLKKQINNKKHEINFIKLNENKRKSHQFLDAELLLLKKKYSKIENEMANLLTILFKEKRINFEIKELGSDFGVINDNMQLDFLTDEEYENMKNTNLSLHENNEEMKLKYGHLEELLSIAQEQVKSQQKLLTEITDNHIELRHLVADLQSSSEEKFLISKAHRDLGLAKQECLKLKTEKEDIESEFLKIKIKLDEFNFKTESENKNLEKQNKNNELKINFLKKYIFLLQEKYCKYTPLVLLTNFVCSYNKYLEKVKEDSNIEKGYFKKFEELISSKLKNLQNSSDSQDLIKLVKYEIKCNFLEDQFKLSQQKLELTEKELMDLRLTFVDQNEQWKTIQALFSDKPEDEKESKEMISKLCQTEITEFKSVSTSTETMTDIKADTEVPVPSKRSSNASSKRSSPTGSPILLSPAKTVLQRQNTIILSSQSPIQEEKHDELNASISSLENQLKQAKSLASKRSNLLLETENKLAEANGRINEMEKLIDEQRRNFRSDNYNTEKKTSGIIESTISSLQSLLSEKDTTLNHYQDLLKTEREQHLKSCQTYDKEIHTLKKTHNDLENLIQTKNMEILELKTKFEANSRRGSQNSGKNLMNDEFDQNCDNSLHEISDEKIEEMFLDESKNFTTSSFGLNLSESNQDESSVKQLQQLQVQIRESKNREIFLEKTIRTKDEEILIFKEKLALLHEREKNDATISPEIEQLRILLEEKDKHINDLMETLTNFHDDQQRFISETSLYSADQMTQLETNLTRCGATNRILQTQLDALKRQLATLTQREKQSRDLANTLRNQLIKRPVVSIKTELNSRTKNEQQQKRIQSLELELEEAKREIQKQQSIIDSKRAKNANEVNMWEKQKRYQQNAEKLKTKLEETEKSLEKSRSLLNAARNTISRLEKDKTMIETKVKAKAFMPLNKCCRTPSCPNLRITKYGQYESPETISTGRSDFSTGIIIDNSSADLINELKACIDAQNRKIYALELSSKGSNAMTTEIEKLQEKNSALEAQNIRWEARNLQLQLDVDLLRQGDENDRNKKRIKHLEDYILALKEELAQSESQKEYASQTEIINKPTTTQAEQTILALKRIVEGLKVENKHLKEGRNTYYSCRNGKGSETTVELTRLQQLYTEAMNKISELQIEMQLKNNCRNINKNHEKGDGDFMQELRFVKDQLIKKTQLLEKAKILLTRAAAKEKSLKEQLSVWKRKCSELQNVPVIDEISE